MSGVFFRESAAKAMKRREHPQDVLDDPRKID
jgi:hypothetical protein